MCLLFTLFPRQLWETKSSALRSPPFIAHQAMHCDFPDAFRYITMNTTNFVATVESQFHLYLPFREGPFSVIMALDLAFLFRIKIKGSIETITVPPWSAILFKAHVFHSGGKNPTPFINYRLFAHYAAKDEHISGQVHLSKSSDLLSK